MSEPAMQSEGKNPSQKAQELENFGAQKVWAKVKLKTRELTKRLFKKELAPSSSSLRSFYLAEWRPYTQRNCPS